jgi:hypothetical protein
MANLKDGKTCAYTVVNTGKHTPARLSLDTVNVCIALCNAELESIAETLSESHGHICTNGLRKMVERHAEQIRLSVAQLREMQRDLIATR